MWVTSLGLAGEAGIFASRPFYRMFSGVPNGPLRLSPPQVHAAVHNSGTTTSDIRLHYWRDTPFEVDFVLQRGIQLIPVEVKSGAKPRSLQGMAAFEQRFRPRRSLIVGEGHIPLDEFLTVSAHQWFEET